MRKRHVLLAAAVAGLAALGTVMAQQPNYPPPTGMIPPPENPSPLAGIGQGQAKTGTNYTAPRVSPATSGNLPATTVRPFSQWTPNQPGYTANQPYTGVRPAGGVQPNNTRQRLTSPVQAGLNGVVPVSASELPPPNMDLPTFKPGAAATTPPSNAKMPPPAVSVEPESKFVVTPPYPIEPNTNAAAQLPTGTTPPSSLPVVPTLPLVPVPPETTSAKPTTPTIPAAPTTTPTIPAASTTQPTPTAPPTVTIVPSAPAATPGILPVPGTPPAAVSPIGSGNVVPPAPTITSAMPARSAPSVSVEAICPKTVVFGQELKYDLVVKNTGAIAIAGVRLEDDVPTGSRFVSSDPPAEMNGDRLSWSIGALEAGAERRVSIRVKPGDEGPIRSRATASFSVSVDAESQVTRPRLTATIVGAEVCRAGEEMTFQIKVTNSGSGPATKMMLQARLSDGLYHPQGSVIEAELASVLPGDTKVIPLKVSAAKAGLQGCQISIGADGSPDATAKASVNVVEPLLVVKQTGPAKVHVRAEPVYAVELSNPGTATTDPVSVYAVVPDGFEYVQGSDGASYNPNNRAVSWSLPALAPGSLRTVSLKLRAASATDALLRTVATAAPAQQPGGIVPVGGVAVRAGGRTLESKAETAIKAEGVAAIRFEVLDLDDPVEVGKEAIYEIRVTNQGTGECTNVQLSATMAEGTSFSGSSGPTQIKAQGQQLSFEPIQKLAAKGEVIYRVRVRGSVAGDQRFTVQLTCDQVRNPVSKEESTKFYKE